MKRSFPLYTQHDAMDCGPTCLRMVAAYYGRKYTPRYLRERCFISRQGVSLRGITYCIIYTTYDEIFNLNTPTPKFVIDEVHYDSKWEGVILNRFEKDLTGKTPKEMDYPLYFYFHDGKFVNGYNWYEDVKVLF